MPPPAATQSPPNAPDLVLRVGFAGKRQLDRPKTATVRTSLQHVFSTIAQRLTEIAPVNHAENVHPVPSISRLNSHRRPTLRLIHGLCEGADSIAFDVLENLNTPGLEKDFTAVVPFPIADYRHSRDPAFLPDFDRQLAASSYVVVPDGIYDKPAESTTPAPLLNLANRRRARAYRSQSALLLHQPALLVAVVNPDLGAKPGGSLETIRSALDFDLPVVLVHPESGEVFLIGKNWEDHAAVAGALLVFIAAVIPAAVAAFNGIRFQSECQRLAERSAVMQTILEGRPSPASQQPTGGRLAEIHRLHSRILAAHHHPDSNPGSWSLESLHLSEKIANDFVQEVAEWSVLYAKELVEP